MKLLSYFAALLILLFAGACDKVKHPIQENGGGGADTSVIYVRKVLVEDYTGHQCGNCPPANAEAEKLYEKHKGKVVVLSVHAGFYARTGAGYPTSYTTTAGNEWFAPSPGFALPGTPNGMVNRKDYLAGGSPVIYHTDWAAAVDQALKDEYILGLEIIPSYSSNTRSLKTTVKAKFLKPYDNPLKLSVLLVEDSVIGPQTDYSLNPDKIPAYVFKYMLRGAINGSWGSDLKDPADGTVAANDSITRIIPAYAVNPAFNEKQVYVVAFVYDAGTREVLQVEKVKILN
jgi:hypothetical protein